MYCIQRASSHCGYASKEIRCDLCQFFNGKRFSLWYTEHLYFHVKATSKGKWPNILKLITRNTNVLYIKLIIDELIYASPFVLIQELWNIPGSNFKLYCRKEAAIQLHSETEILHMISHRPLLLPNRLHPPFQMARPSWILFQRPDWFSDHDLIIMTNFSRRMSPCCS